MGKHRGIDTSAPVCIEVHEVGAAFGHAARVRLIDRRGRKGRTVHNTRIVPFNFRGAAHRLATEWCEAQGLIVSEAP